MIKRVPKRRIKSSNEDREDHVLPIHGVVRSMDAVLRAIPRFVLSIDEKVAGRVARTPETRGIPIDRIFYGNIMSTPGNFGINSHVEIKNTRWIFCQNRWPRRSRPYSSWDFIGETLWKPFFHPSTLPTTPTPHSPSISWFIADGFIDSASCRLKWPTICWSRCCVKYFVHVVPRSDGVLVLPQVLRATFFLWFSLA